jgi:hypothetical protein
MHATLHHHVIQASKCLYEATLHIHAHAMYWLRAYVLVSINLATHANELVKYYLLMSQSKIRVRI